MASKSSKHKSVKEQFVGGIPIKDEKDFVKQCGKIVANLLNVKQVGFSRMDNAAAVWMYRLSGPGSVEVNIGRRTYRIIPFYLGTVFSYWIGTVLYIDRLNLTSVSIIIICSTTLQTIQPLLRAEWDCAPTGPVSKHAQPHWHVYSQAIEMHSTSQPFETVAHTEEFLPPAETGRISEKIANIWEGGEDFHYAMAAEWAKRGRGIAHENWNEGGVLKWLDGCLKYILDQFEFLKSKGAV